MRHPLHPMLVHFPVACWTLGSLCDIAGIWWQAWPLWQWSAALLLTGCVMGLLAAFAGLLELVRLPVDHPANSLARLHMMVALGTWCLYATSLFLRTDGLALTEPGMAAILVSALAWLGVLATGFLGGTLVYQHGVGRRP